MAAKPRKQLTRAELRTPHGKFAAHLAALLSERGMDSGALSAKSGIADPTIRKWLRGEGFPTVTSLPSLAKGLHTPEHPMLDYRMVLPAKL